MFGQSFAFKNFNVHWVPKCALTNTFLEHQTNFEYW